MSKLKEKILGISAKKKWLVISTLAILTATITFSGCTQTSATPSPSPGPTPEPGVTGSFKIIGSNTVEPLSVVWAEEYMKLNPEVSISVSGPGSGVGIASLIDGTTDIAQASRGIKSKEIDQAQSNGIDPYEIQVATDALSVVVHPSNPVSELTTQQLSAIFTSQITNWSELGGEEAPIVALSRDTNSGTHVFFKEHVVQMKGLDTENKELEYGPEVLFLPSTKEGVEQVAANPNAIFYPGLGYVTSEVKSLAVKKTIDDPAILPSVATALDGSYSISRPLLYYTNGEPTGVIKAFIDYCLSDAGQAFVTEVGYVPLR
jgi:phosphate transport system substrate-binding protein